MGTFIAASVSGCRDGDVSTVAVFSGRWDGDTIEKW